MHPGSSSPAPALAAVLVELIFAGLADYAVKNLWLAPGPGNAAGPNAALWIFALANLFTACMMAALGWLLVSRRYPRWVGVAVLVIGLLLTLYTPLVYAAARALIPFGQPPLFSPASELGFSSAAVAALGALMLLRGGAKADA